MAFARSLPKHHSYTVHCTVVTDGAFQVPLPRTWQCSPSCTKGAQDTFLQINASHHAAKCWGQQIQACKLPIPKSVHILPSSLLLCLVSLAEIGDFIILVLSRDTAVAARTGGGDTRAKTTSASHALKSCSVFLDVKTQHRFYFYLSLHVLRE